MLSKLDFIRCMKMIKKNQAAIKNFELDLSRYFESSWFNLGDDLISTQIAIVKIAMNDENDESWIDWYIYENYWGKSELEAGYYNTKPIKNLNDLYWLLKEQNKGK